MKLLRHNAPGAEKPGLDAAGRVRDLSRMVVDIGGDTLRPKGLRGTCQKNSG